MLKNAEYVLTEQNIKRFRVRYGWSSRICNRCGRKIRKGFRIIRCKNKNRARIFHLGCWQKLFV